MSAILLDWIFTTLAPSSPFDDVRKRDRLAALAILDKLPTHMALPPRLVKAIAACFVHVLRTDPLSGVSASLFRLVLHHPSLSHTVRIGKGNAVRFVTEYLQALSAAYADQHENENDDDDDDDDDDDGGERQFCAKLMCSIRRSPSRDEILHHPRVLALLCDPMQHTESSWCSAFLRCPSPALFNALGPAIEYHLRQGDPEIAWTVLSTAPKAVQRNHRPWLLTRLPLLLERIHDDRHGTANFIALCQFAAVYDDEMQCLTRDRWTSLLRYIADKGYPPTLSRAALKVSLRQTWPVSDVPRLMELVFNTRWVLLDENWVECLDICASLDFCAAAATYMLEQCLRGEAAVWGLRQRSVLLKFLRLFMADLETPLPGVLGMFRESAVLRPQWTANVLAEVGPTHAQHLCSVLQFLFSHVDVQVVALPFQTAARWLDAGIALRLRMPLHRLDEAASAIVEEQWGDDDTVARVLAHHAPQRTLVLMQHMLKSSSVVPQQLAVEYLHRLRGQSPYREEGWPDAIETALYKLFCSGWYERSQIVFAAGGVNEGARRRAVVLQDNGDGTYTVRLYKVENVSSGKDTVRVLRFVDIVPVDVPSADIEGKDLLLSMWAEAARNGLTLPMAHHKLFIHLLAYQGALLDETLKDALRALLCALGDARCPRFRVHLHRFLHATKAALVPSLLFRVLGHVRRAAREPREIDTVLRSFPSAPPALTSLVMRHQDPDPPTWLVAAMIEHSTAGVNALAKSRISPACLWRRLSEYVRSRPQPALSKLREKHNFLHAVLYARRIPYYGRTGDEIPVPEAEAPFFEQLTASVLQTLEHHHQLQTDVGSLARMSVKCLLKVYTCNPQLVTPAVARMALRMHHLTLTAPTLNVIFSGTSYLDHDFGTLVRAKLAMPLPAHLRTVLRVRQMQDDAAAARVQPSSQRPRTRETVARDLVTNMTTDTLRELFEYMDFPLVAGTLT